jgi:hypothetical protein
MFKLTIWWKDAIVKLCLLYCVFQILIQLIGIIQIFYNLNNPLIPEQLAYYASFSNMLLVPFWLLGEFLFFVYLKKKTLLAAKFWVVPVSLLLLLIGNSVILFLAFRFNPFS